MFPDPVGPGSRADVPPDFVGDERLVAAARTARAHAYSPYSGVRVGAALLAEDGRLFAGCNVENASYGLTVCAERGALLKAVSEGARRFTAIAIVSNRPAPLMPCGACRQMLREFGEEIRVVCVGEEGERVERRIDELLPFAFDREDLPRDLHRASE